jgi:hypothetical protein
MYASRPLIYIYTNTDLVVNAPCDVVSFYDQKIECRRYNLHVTYHVCMHARNFFMYFCMHVCTWCVCIYTSHTEPQLAGDMLYVCLHLVICVHVYVRAYASTCVCLYLRMCIKRMYVCRNMRKYLYSILKFKPRHYDRLAMKRKRVYSMNTTAARTMEQARLASCC